MSIKFTPTTNGVQPSKGSLLQCSIAGVNYHTLVNNDYVVNFNPQELRIYEDNCKFYFTGQLIIEAQLNTFERYLAPQAEVVISFVSPPNPRIYTEKFRVYSYESKPREGDIKNSMVVTINLMGNEYFKDKSEQVQQNFSNIPATEAARAIHSKYIQENGGMKIPLPSIGMIGLQLHPHQVLSKQPSKAIHDLLDKAIFPVSSFGPGVYYRDKPGYVIAPLEYLIHSAPITGDFIHEPAQGANALAVLNGYDRVIHFRPMAPPGEDRGGARKDLKKIVPGSLDVAIGNAFTGKGAGGTGYAGGVGKNIIDAFRQLPNIDKNGPGGYQAKEDEFIARLTYSPKYWVSVPLQTGIDVTVGNRVSVTHPVSDEVFTKTLWIARLIHELRFTEGKDRSIVTVNGTTDLFGVYFR